MTGRQSISPWLAEAEPTAPALAGDVDVDVAIVGAGYAGLSAALALREDRTEVAVLEAQFAGFGASGRNAGHLTPTIGKDLPTLARVFGRKRARALVTLAETAVGYVEHLIERHSIACDYAPVGNVIAAVHARQNATVDRVARAAANLGAHGELLEAPDMRRRGLPQAFTRGFLEHTGGILDPGRYLRGLRRAAMSAGTMLFEGTPVLRIEQTQPLVLHTPRGKVRARRVVIATNAYTPTLREVRSTVVPIYVQLFQTAELSAEQRAAVDWHGREGVYTAHEMLESYRLTPGGRIVGGAKHIRYGFGGRALPDVDAAVAVRLESIFRTRFPELRELEITHRWGGRIAFTLDFLPAVGRAGKHHNLLFAVGYAGHGVALGSYSGRMLADLLLERAGPGAALWSRTRIPLPPEPLRWLVVRSLTGLLGVIDGRTDRAAGV
jgi:glycine/D-amino acid oxidase-like deaminating enzyme